MINYLHKKENQHLIGKNGDLHYTVKRYKGINIVEQSNDRQVKSLERNY